MLRFTAISTDEGVSQEVRNATSTGLAVSPGDDLYVITKSGVCIMRKNTQLLQKYLAEDFKKMSDGNILHDACTGKAVDIVWENRLNDRRIPQKELVAALRVDAMPVAGGLWVLDAWAHALRLVVNDRLVTVVGGYKNRHRDGLARILKGAPRKDAYASLASPCQFVRMQDSLKMVIVEEAPFKRGPRLRILDMSTWRVTTVVTKESSVLSLQRCFVQPFSEAGENDNLVVAITGSHHRYDLDIETGALTVREKRPRELATFALPVTSSVPLCAASSSYLGVHTTILTRDGRFLASSSIPGGDYAYLPNINTLVHSNGEHGLSVATDAFCYQRDTKGHFRPWKLRMKCEDRSSFCIDNENFPGDLTLRHDASGGTWRLHASILYDFWPYKYEKPKDQQRQLPNVIRKSLLPFHSVNAFLRLLHCAPIFDGLDIPEKLRLALEMLYLGSQCLLDWSLLIPWLVDTLNATLFNWSDWVCHALIQAWNNPDTPWAKDDAVMLTMGVIIGHRALANFKRLHAAYTPSSPRHTDLLNHVLKCSKIKPESVRHTHYQNPGGLGAENFTWFPLDTSTFSGQSILDVLHSKYGDEAKSAEHGEIPSSTVEASKSVKSKDSYADLDLYVAFTLDGVDAAALACYNLLYLRWNWFRRLMALRECVEAKTRIVQLPSWVTPNICTAILDSILNEFQTELTTQEACTILELGAELELFDFDDRPSPVFEDLHRYCCESLHKMIEQDDTDAGLVMSTAPHPRYGRFQRR